MQVNKLKTKKGQVIQVIVLIVIMIVIVIIGILFMTMASKFSKTLATVPMINNSVVGSAVNNQAGGMSLPFLDEFVFFFYLFGNIALIIGATRTNFSPTMIFIFIFVTLIAIFIAFGMANLFQAFTQTSALADSANSLPLTSVIFSKYFPLFTCVISGIIMAIMWGKSGGDIIN